MRSLRALLVFVALVTASACFQMTTVVTVKGDGSGTIDHSMLVTKAALAQLRQFAALGGGRGRGLDLISEDQARTMASSLGPGVTYVSSSPIDTPLAEGRRAQYAFADITQLRLSQQPEAPAGVSLKAQGLSTESGAITCTFTQEANGNAVLQIHLPEPSLPGVIADSGSGGQAVEQQLAMVRTLLAGARVVIAVEPAGQIVRTSSPYVDGGRVTLVDVSLDRLLGDDALLARLRATKNADDLRAAIKDVPGVRITLDPQVTIEFAPAK